jgi:predicted acetyltransferase
MASIEIRSVRGEELIDVAYQLNTYAFRATPPGPEKETWSESMRRRGGTDYIVVFEDGRPMAGAFTSPQTQNLRGKLFPTAALWGVATLPEGRRKGYCRKAIEKLLAVNHELGRATTCLYPFRESFYERMGYVSFPFTMVVKLSPRALVASLKIETDGQIERLPISEGYPLYRNFVEKVRDQVHGMALFDLPDVETIKKNNQFWLALARVRGEVQGLILYSLQGEEITKFNMRCTRFYYTSSPAKYLLLAWIARHVDQADRAEIRLPPFERPNTWLADLELRTEFATWGPMGRVLALDRMDGLPVGEGAFTARVCDPLCPWNEGVWRFDGSGGRLSVSPGGQAECELSIQSLSSLVYGLNDPADFRYSGWGDPDPRVLETMRSMFPTLSPHLHEEF